MIHEPTLALGLAKHGSPAGNGNLQPGFIPSQPPTYSISIFRNQSDSPSTARPGRQHSGGRVLCFGLKGGAHGSTDDFGFPLSFTSESVKRYSCVPCGGISDFSKSTHGSLSEGLNLGARIQPSEIPSPPTVQNGHPRGLPGKGREYSPVETAGRWSRKSGQV